MRHFYGRLRQNFLICAGLIVAIFATSADRVSAYLATDVPVLLSGYTNTFYYVSGTNGYFRSQQTGSTTTYFWQLANEIQSVEDAYLLTGNAAYQGMITNLLNGFIKSNGANWSYNGYNDDDLWATMAFAMGAQLTGKTNYAAIAKANFDMIYARAWDTNLGGGLYWEYPNNASKNACVNGPGAIAAALLFQIYGDTNYWNKATNIYYWERSVLYNSGTGRIADNIGTNGVLNGGPTTYNQGTFIGAADLLGQTNDASLTATYTMNSMSSAGYLPQYGIGGNNSIFNSIFIRWLARFMKNRNISAPYQTWLQNQANAVWNGRRTVDNLSWCQWPQQTPNSTNFYSYDCISSFEAMLAAPPTQTNVTTVVTLSQSDALGSSSFESGLNWSDGNAPAVGHDYLVNGLTLRTPADGSAHFFTGNSLTLSNAAVLACKNTSGGAGVSVGTDLFLDNGEIADYAGNSTTFYARLTLRAGGGQLDPQVNSFTISALIGGAGSLRVTASSLSLTGGTVIFSGLNTYTGGTIINAAQTLRLSGEGTLGDPSGSLTFSNSFGYGSVDLNGQNLAIGNLNGAGGNIFNNNTNIVTLTVSNNVATAGTFSGTINGYIGLLKTGNGSLTLAVANTFNGGVTLAGGTLAIGNDSALGSGLVDFNGGTAGAIIQSVDGTAHTLTNAFNFDGGAGGNTIFGGTGNLKFIATPPGNGTAKTLTVNNPQTEFSGVLAGASARMVAGTGVLIFSGANTYSLGTTIKPGATLQLGNGSTNGSLSTSGAIDDEGTLIFNRSDAIMQGTHFSSAPITGAGSLIQTGSGTTTLTAANIYTGSTIINSGILFINGSVASATTIVNTNAILGGIGTLGGNVAVQAGGTLMPGNTNTIGTLSASGNASVSGTVFLKINRNNLPVSDEFVASGITVNSGATLTVTNIGNTNLVAGDTFKLFNVPISGAFNTVNLPLLPNAALMWTNQLAVNGTISVTAAPVINTNRTNITAGVNGSLLTLSWPQDHTGWTLQVQNNSLGLGLNTNWVDVSGSTGTNTVVVPITITNGAVFYRLKF